MRITNHRVVRAVAATLAVGLVIAGCASERDSEDGGGETFNFAAPGDPIAMDPGLASDGETFRVTRQAFEALLKHEDGGTKLEGALAKSWDSNEAGTEWTFHLREGVTFHDGEKLTAEAVCKNYDRWFNWEGAYQSTAVSYYWQTIFGGFKKNESKETPPANYAGCTAKDELTPVIKVKQATANLPGGFSLQAFAMHSPKAIDAYAKEPASGEGDAITFPAYSQKGGVVAGTGPYKVSEWDKGNHEVTMTRYDDYWGEKGKIENLVFRTIDKEDARRQALEAGNIDGYDLVAPGDVKTLEKKGYQVPVRDVFNIFYLGFTQEHNPVLKKKEVRQAIAHALDRQNLVDTQLPEGSEVATQFIPNTVDGYSDKVTTYDYNVNKAKQLLAAAGEKNPKLKFCYPTEVTRPYMPAPQAMFELMKEDLKSAGIQVQDASYKWNPDYTEVTRDGGCDLYLLGWTGDFNDAYNFIGTWFAEYMKEWGFKDKKVFDAMQEAESEPDVAERVKKYQHANEVIMDFLPGVPVSSSPPSIAFGKNVNPPTVSPLTQENFAQVSFK